MYIAILDDAHRQPTCQPICYLNVHHTAAKVRKISRNICQTIRPNPNNIQSETDLNLLTCIIDGLRGAIW